jgi:hypothetical protein
MDEDNNGRFPDDSLVEVRYPHTRQEEQGDRCAWPWLPGSVLGQRETRWGSRPSIITDLAERLKPCAGRS